MNAAQIPGPHYERPREILKSYLVGTADSLGKHIKPPAPASIVIPSKHQMAFAMFFAVKVSP